MENQTQTNEFDQDWWSQIVSKRVWQLLFSITQCDKHEKVIIMKYLYNLLTEDCKDKFEKHLCDIHESKRRF